MAGITKKKTRRLSPAQYVVKKFGGVRATARAIGRSPSTVSKWLKPRSERGTAGTIPTGAQKLILDASRVRRLKIRPEHLIFGWRS